jgi:hypothetical protein
LKLSRILRGRIKNPGPGPMNIREAVEAMKIVAPYAPQFTGARDVVALMRPIMAGIQKDAPLQALRLVALMEHKSVERIAEELADKSGADLIEKILGGFGRNDLALLVDAAYFLGLSEVRWNYGD